MSNLRLGVVMDPISQINPAKDSTLAMLLEAQTRGYLELEMDEKSGGYIIRKVMTND